MSNLNVALTLRLNNLLSKGAREAQRDLRGIGAAANSIAGGKAGALAGDLNRVAGAASRADVPLRRVVQDAAALRASGNATGGLVQGLTATATAAGRADGALRRVGANDGLRRAGTAAGSLARGLDSAASASTRVRPPRIDAAALSRGAEAAGRYASALDRAAAARDRLSRAGPIPAGSGGRASGRATRRQAEAERAGDGRPSEGGGGSLVALGRGGLAAGGAYYATRAAARATIGEAVEFEKAWAEVQKKVNDAPNPAAMQQLERSVRRMGIELGIPRAQVAKMTAEAGAAGIQFADLERFTRLAAKSSIAWDMGQDDAAQKLAEIKAGTGMTIGQMEQLGDKINALGDNSAAKERDIVEMFGRSGAAAREAGVSYDASLAMLTAVRSAGMQPEIVSRWFNSFAGGLRTIGEKKKSAQEALKGLGLDVNSVEIGMQRDAVGTMMKLFDALSKSPNAVSQATKLFGREWWDETMRAKSTIPEIQKQLALLDEPTRWRGSMDNSLNIQLATTANHLARLNELSGEIGDRLGRWALPGINESIQKAVSLMDELERRRRVKKAGQGEPDEARGEDPLALPGEKWAREKVNQVERTIIDRLLGKDATVDRSRNIANKALLRANDLDNQVTNLGAEEANLEAQEKTAKGAQKNVLREKLEDLRQRRKAAIDEARIERTGAGAAAARDMTDVEVGDAAAQHALDVRRAAQQRVNDAKLARSRPKPLAVFDPEARPGALQRISEQERQRVDRLGAGAPTVQTIAPAADQAAGALSRLTGSAGSAADAMGGRSSSTGRFTPAGPRAQDAEAGVPRAGGGSGSGGFSLDVGLRSAKASAEGLKAAMQVDLAGAATTAMAGYERGVSTGGAKAIAEGHRIAAQLRAALSFNVSPTITPRASMPSVPTVSGGAAKPAAAASSQGAGSSAGSVGGASKQASAGPTFSGPIHVHGVSDLAGFRREVSRHADNKARDAQGDALHDVGSWA